MATPSSSTFSIEGAAEIAPVHWLRQQRHLADLQKHTLDHFLDAQSSRHPFVNRVAWFATFQHIPSEARFVAHVGRAREAEREGASAITWK